MEPRQNRFSILMLGQRLVGDLTSQIIDGVFDSWHLFVAGGLGRFQADVVGELHTLSDRENFRTRNWPSLPTAMISGCKAPDTSEGCLPN